MFLSDHFALKTDPTLNPKKTTLENVLSSLRNYVIFFLL